MNTKLISLDTSSTATGWAYYENGTLKKSGVLLSNRSLETEQRVNQMCKMIINVLDTYQPDMIVIEMVALTRNALIQRILTEIVGVVRGYSIIHNICFFRLRPAEWRSLVKRDQDKIGGEKREVLKQWSKQYVLEEFGKTVTDDESDAILIGLAYIKLADKKGV